MVYEKATIMFRFRHLAFTYLLLYLLNNCPVIEATKDELGKIIIDLK